MYILLESTDGPISEASIYNIDCMGTADTDLQAMAWRNNNIEYRTYKYVYISEPSNKTN